MRDRINDFMKKMGFDICLGLSFSFWVDLDAKVDEI